MLTLFTVSICFFCIFLTGWTAITYFTKKNSKKFIVEELKKLFGICKEFFLSLKHLMTILASQSFSSESNEANPVDKNVLDEDEQTLSLVQPVKEIKAESLEVTNEEEEDDDIAISSFSAEVIEVINEEEEKVA